MAKKIDLIRQGHLEILSDSKYKLTKPRCAVLDFLYSTDRLVSADQVFLGTKKQKIDKVTVYRILDLFEKLKIVNQQISKDGIKKYELTEGEGHHCHHAICDGCGTTEHIEDEEIEKAIDALIKKFKKVKYVKEHSLEFVGTCTSCKNHKTIKN